MSFYILPWVLHPWHTSHFSWRPQGSNAAKMLCSNKNGQQLQKLQGDHCTWPSPAGLGPEKILSAQRKNKFPKSPLPWQTHLSKKCF